MKAKPVKLSGPTYGACIAAVAFSALTGIEGWVGCVTTLLWGVAFFGVALICFMKRTSAAWTIPTIYYSCLLSTFLPAYPNARVSSEDNINTILMIILITIILFLLFFLGELRKKPRKKMRQLGVALGIVLVMCVYSYIWIHRSNTTFDTSQPPAIECEVVERRKWFSKTGWSYYMTAQYENIKSKIVFSISYDEYNYFENNKSVNVQKHPGFWGCEYYTWSK